MRKALPIWVTVLAGLVVLLDYYFFPVARAKLLDNYLTDIFRLLVTFSSLLGLINLTRIHATNIARRKPDWWMSVVLFAVMVPYLVAGLVKGPNAPFFNFVYNYVQTPIDSTIFSLLAFFIASAAYRAFRVRSLEATILMLAGFIVLLGNTPIGSTISSYIPMARQWLMEIPNGAGMRAILIGATVGSFAVAMRILLGIERSYLGGSGMGGH